MKTIVRSKITHDTMWLKVINSETKEQARVGITRHRIKITAHKSMFNIAKDIDGIFKNKPLDGNFEELFNYITTKYHNKFIQASAEKHI